MEDAGDIKIIVERKGVTNVTALVNYKTEDDTAIAGTDYVASEGLLIFDVGIKQREIVVTIIDNDNPEPDRDFKVNLSNLKISEEPADSNYTATITKPTC